MDWQTTKLTLIITWLQLVSTFSYNTLWFHQLIHCAQFHKSAVFLWKITPEITLLSTIKLFLELFTVVSMAFLLSCLALRVLEFKCSYVRVIFCFSLQIANKAVRFPNFRQISQLKCKQAWWNDFSFVLVLPEIFKFGYLYFFLHILYSTHCTTRASKTSIYFLYLHMAVYQTNTCCFVLVRRSY